MFLLSLFGNHRVYSTHKLASQNAAHWLKKFVIDNHWLWGEDNLTGRYRKQFEEAFQREDYHRCVIVWNTYAIDKPSSNHPQYNSTIVARIQAIQLDEKLT